MPLELNVEDMETVDLPWNKTAKLQDVVYEGGMKVIRLRFKEGRRFTIIDLDHATAQHLGQVLSDWAGRNPAAD